MNFVVQSHTLEIGNQILPTSTGKFSREMCSLYRNSDANGPTSNGQCLEVDNLANNLMETLGLFANI